MLLENFAYQIIVFWEILTIFAAILIIMHTSKSTMANKLPFYCVSLISLLLLMFITFGCTSAKEKTITVANNSDFDRMEEIAEVYPAPQELTDSASAYVLIDEDGMPMQYQITHDGKLIFPVSLAPNEKASYSIISKVELSPEVIKSSSSFMPSPSIAYTVRHDCQDDFAWENEHSGYRLYGPLFKRQYGNVHGYDIWCKRGTEPVVDEFYNLDHGPEHITYHKDHGKGFDGYTVGPTLGAGACALMLDSTICYPTAYDQYEVLDNGPLRLTVRFTIDSIPFGVDEAGQTKYITEKRTLSLDRMAHFNKVTTEYEGVDSLTPIVAGIVVHADNPSGYRLIDDFDAISVVDLSDDISAGNGEIYIGLALPSSEKLAFMPFDKIKANAVGQALALSEYIPGSPFTYYWGAGWSKGSVPDSATWDDIVRKQSQIVDSPLNVSIN